MAFATALAGASAVTGALTARHANGSLIVGGIDLLLGAASQAVTAFSYSDNTNDQADDLTIEIADPARTWMQTWLPKKGIECTGTIKVFNWNLPGDTREVPCGVFWLDQIDFKGPPNTVSVKATSVPVVTGIKTQKKFRAWEGDSLSKIVGQIAEENGLKLVWSAKDDPKLKRTDQVDSADLEFIRDKAKDNSLDMRIYNRQLIIYSPEEYESRPAVYVIVYGHANILQFSFSSKLNETYKKATNAYVDEETGEEIRSTYEPDEPPEGSGSELQLNLQTSMEDVGDLGGDGDGDGGDGPLRVARADSEPPYGPEGSGPIEFNNEEQAKNEANEKKAKSHLREKNKKEKECTMVVAGNPDYLSGLNVELVDFGIFSGKWFISSTMHSISPSGYVTELKMRMCLKGY